MWTTIDLCVHALDLNGLSIAFSLMLYEEAEHGLQTLDLFPFMSLKLRDQLLCFRLIYLPRYRLMRQVVRSSPSRLGYNVMVEQQGVGLRCEHARYTIARTSELLLYEKIDYERSGWLF